MDGLKPHNEVCDCYREYDFPIVSGPNKGKSYSTMTYGVGWHREWMSPDGKMAVGMNDDDTVDEVLTIDGGGIHIEAMSDQSIWMMVHHRYVFHFMYDKGRRINLYYSYDNGD